MTAVQPLAVLVGGGKRGGWWILTHELPTGGVVGSPPVGLGNQLAPISTAATHAIGIILTQSVNQKHVSAYCGTRVTLIVN
jgi:hypothetical protein